MLRLTLTAALFLAAAPALAFHCPADMEQIDAALAGGTSVSAEELAQISTWRAEGEALHSSGDHQGAVDTLAKAKEMLGLN